VALGIVLVVAATSKGVTPAPVSQEWGEAFGVGPAGGDVLVWGAVVAEGCVGTLLLAGAWPRLSSVMALALFALFFGVSVAAWVGVLPLVDCRCFGSFEFAGRAGVPMFLRNSLLLSLSGLVTAHYWLNGDGKDASR